MKTKTILRRFGILLLCLWIGISQTTMSVYAWEHSYAEREGTLTLHFSENGAGFAGVAFSVYRVADISENGTYTLAGDFVQYSVCLDNLNSSGWRALAQTLDAYAARDAISPFLTQETEQDGSFQITGLSAGLYLVSGEQYVDGNLIYTPEPMLVSVPGQTASGEWNYNIEVSCKFDRENAQALLTSRKVQKVWADEGNEEKRPEEISVQLLENGIIVDTVVLNRENNWEYTWENLSGSSKWQIAETSVPDGYTVTATQENNVFVLTNTYPAEQPTRLPQTGMLWWPVPILVCSGLLFLAAGLVLRRKHGDSHEE